MSELYRLDYLTGELPRKAMRGNPPDPTPVPHSAAGPADATEPSGPKTERFPPGALTFPCPVCGTPRAGAAVCEQCGYLFPPAGAAAAATRVRPADLLLGRYELGTLLTERGPVARFRGLDHGSGQPTPLPVAIVRGPAIPLAQPVDPASAAEPTAPAKLDGSGPSFELPEPSPGDEPTLRLREWQALLWPGIDWEDGVLKRARHLSLPRVLDRFPVGESEYLIEEAPPGRPLREAWNDDTASMRDRFGWLTQLAEALAALHRAGAILEGLRPEQVLISPAGQAILADLGGLLPLPPPPGSAPQATPATSPEVRRDNGSADARSDLYAFGALLAALWLGRDLTDQDVAGPGEPLVFFDLCPDAHPLVARLIGLTLGRDPSHRFPTDESAREDPTGFAELLWALRVCQATLDRVRLDVAAWTNTGMVRPGNEDAVAVFHAAQARQEEQEDFALILLADGMGGTEGGEVAAALAVQAMRQHLFQHPPLATLTIPPAPLTEPIMAVRTLPPLTGRPGVSAKPIWQQRLRDALCYANRRVHQAPQQAVGRRGMGCTAEAVFLEGGDLFVGHVGDSRTYLFHRGELQQLTHDQTLVARLVELGQLTPEEAFVHPRRSELQQAIGGRPDVEPELCHARVVPGDWVLVCSDGLSNQLPAETLQAVLTTGDSAERVARRLINLANRARAADNVSVAVIRCV